MATDYDRIAAKYRDAKHHAWRMHIEHYTFFDLLGELHGQSVLDLACGEGFLTRVIKDAGAGRVLGVDGSHETIRLAREEEARAPLGIEYLTEHDRYEPQPARVTLRK